LQFINNSLRTILVNVAGNRAVTVLPGQLISLPVKVGLEVGLTAVDEHGAPLQKPPEELIRMDAPPAQKPKPTPVVDTDAIIEALGKKIDVSIADKLGGLLAGGDQATLKLILERLEGMQGASGQPAAQQTAAGSTGASKYIPMQEDYFERAIKQDTSKIKVDSEKAGTDDGAADELAALLGGDGEGSDE